MPRAIFRACVLAAAGPLPDELTVENMIRWTSLRRGIFKEDFDDSVTHLLCTKEQFDNKVPRVKDALKKSMRCFVVHYEWLRFSAELEKKQPVKDYLLENASKKQKATERELAKFEKGSRDAEKFVDTNLFHIYIDREYFAYQVKITCEDESTGKLWESNAKPHLYWFTAKFLRQKGDSQPCYYRPSGCSGKWQDEMNAFMAFFEKQTGLEWQDRVLGEKSKPSSFYQYTPPTGGKPVGRRLRFSYDQCRKLNAELRRTSNPSDPSLLVEGTDKSINEGNPADQDQKQSPLDKAGSVSAKVEATISKIPSLRCNESVSRPKI